MVSDFMRLMRVYLKAYELGEKEAKAAQKKGGYGLLTLPMDQKMDSREWFDMLGYVEGWNDQEIITK